MKKNDLATLNPYVETRNLDIITQKTGNLYKSIAIIAKRANQVNAQLKEELHNKLTEFASSTDSLEEVFENREQIEIARHYERLPNPCIIATEEFLRGDVFYRSIETLPQE